MSTLYTSYNKNKPPFLDGIQKFSVAIGLAGLLIMLLSWAQVGIPKNSWTLTASLGLITLGTIMFTRQTYAGENPGIKNNGVFFSSIANKGFAGWITALVITFFYIVLYLKAEWLGLGKDGAENTGLVALFDPLSQWMHGKQASQWFVYGVLYTLAILIFGIKFIYKYRHNKYEVIRTISVMFFQLFFAFLIPEILEMLHPETASAYFGKDLKNMWPLDYDFFDEWQIRNMSKAGFLGSFFLIFGLLMIFVISPILTYFYGKRWYCSWVCGCGGLAETAGDPFRHLSDKSLNAWRIERWMIHSVLLFSFVMTIAIIYGYLGNNPDDFLLTRTSFTIISIVLLLILAGAYYFLQTKNVEDGSKNSKYIVTGAAVLVAVILLINYIAGSGNAFFLSNYSFRGAYGLWIGAVFSGIVGVGFYPLMGSRVWCRFGCPMAAILGIQQKLFSRFRITTNGGQCISCGNCSTYCEMGIDVRAYAQKGQNIVRASCVGCGICSAVCPRGVLKLENGSSDIYSKTEAKKAILITEDQVKML